MKKLTQYRKTQLCYIAMDALTSVLVWLSFLLFRWLVFEGRILSMTTVMIPAFDFVSPLLLYPLFCAGIYYLSGYYMRPRGRSLAREFLYTFLSALPITLIAFFVIIIDDLVADYSAYYLSLLVLFVLQLLLSWLGRLLVTLTLGLHRYRPTTLVLTPEQQEEILSGRVPHFPKGTDRVIIDLPQGTPEQVLYKLVGAIYPKGVDIAFPARTYDVLTGSARFHSLDEGDPLVCVTDLPMSPTALCFKRAFDVTLSLLFTLLLSPLLITLALLVHCSSPGPVIYRQVRIGHYGRPFHILKFRTMYQDAEKDGTPRLSSDDDPRITPVGHFMRRYRLDELPQLRNVLRGDMSFVGPRPERAFFINEIMREAPYYPLIYKIRPGLTSWGPIRVGYTDTLEKMVRRLNYDILYIENMSLLTDLRIMLLTLEVLLDGRGK